jgi:succinate-acetate transporter protein
MKDLIFGGAIFGLAVASGISEQIFQSVFSFYDGNSYNKGAYASASVFGFLVVLLYIIDAVLVIRKRNLFKINSIKDYLATSFGIINILLIVKI